MEIFFILVINPGSTSTKIALFKNDKPEFETTISHSSIELKNFKTIADQYDYRKDMILNELEKADIKIEKLSLVMGRGGLVKPIKSGVYEVNDIMKKDLKNSFLGEHASNLGGLIASEIAGLTANAKAFIADPIVVDEMDEIARFSGHSKFKRYSIFHALNQKAVSRTHAKEIKKEYEDLNLIVVHLGGGISVGVHKKGRVVDVNNALNGDGPFSPERTGTLPVEQLVNICFSNEYSFDEVKKMIKGQGGMVSYLGTNNAREVMLMAKKGIKNAKLVQDAMAYQIAKEIGSAAAVLKGDVDSILITGGMAHNEDIVNFIKEMIKFIAPVFVYPGEDEMKSLALNGLRVLKKEVTPYVYS